MIRFRQFRALALLLGALSLSACSSLRPYETTTPPNVTVTPDVKSGSVRMDVYDVDGKCHMDYRGSVYMTDDKPVKVGLPANRQQYLVFVFWETPLFGSDHSTTYQEYVRLRAGEVYAIKASYADAMYNVTIREQSAHGGAWRDAARGVPKECR